MSQQQQHQTKPNQKRKQNTRKKMNKCDQQNQQNQNSVMCETQGAGDGGSLQQKQPQKQSTCEPIKSMLPLQTKTKIGACNQTANKEKMTINICMEQLQLQMQSILTCSEVNKNQQINAKREKLGSKCSTRRDSLEQRRASVGIPLIPDQERNAENSRPLSKSARLRQKRKATQRNKYIAIDCEMVGVGHNGQDDMLARVSIVNKNGEVLLDKFVKPWNTVTDYRTSVSGIRPKDIENGEDFSEVQDQVVELLQGKILVGHAIRNDLAVLHIKHPYKHIRDTARYKPLCRLVSKGRTPSLKLLSQAILGMEIQIGEHNSVEDARAAMKIYNRLSSDWEKYIQKQQRNSCY